MSALNLRSLASVTELSRASWNHLNGDYPFTRWEFLQALEESGCVSEASGWQSAHLVLQQGNEATPEILGILPLYLKSHSRGEFVFDHAWAEVWHRHGLNYYPKLVTCAPFSPVPGPRFLGREDAQEPLLSAVAQLADQYSISSWHLLFADEKTRTALQAQTVLPLVERQDCHFRWYNRDYGSFDDFLAALVSRRRKMIRKERQAIRDAGIRILKLAGSDIREADWDFFYRCYQQTYQERGMQPYLSRDFFSRLQEEMGEQLFLLQAREQEKPVATALYFHDSRQLYGRYWGAIRPVDKLHFELCYYQGIEWAIQLGLERFDPGVQGIHKYLRGFEPVKTSSWHYIREPVFAEAIKQYCEQERDLVTREYQGLREKTPYRRE